MHIVRGAYHLWPKRVAFRNDYCIPCKAPRRAVATRSFDVGHIFWIPILPVGFWRHWTCSECGRKPHARSKLRPFLWSGLYLLVAVSVIFWAVPPEPEFAVGSWFCRIAAPAAAMALAVRLLRELRQPSLKKRLASVPPAADTACPFCETVLVTGTGGRWSCPACGIVRC